MLSREQQKELMKNAEIRKNGYIKKWLENSTFKAALNNNTKEPIEKPIEGSITNPPKGSYQDYLNETLKKRNKENHKWET